MYAAAYSNLSSSIAEDVDDMCKGAIPHVGSGDILLVYSHHTASPYDYRTPTDPVLFRVYRDMEDKEHRDTLAIYPDTDVSSTPEVFHKVLSDVKEMFPARSYGLIFTSHAKGWVPVGYKENNYITLEARENDYPLTKWLGIESVTGSGIDIKDFPDAIPMKLDFAVMDACLMGCVEFAYELRDKCRYIIFSPTEILSNGFVYTSMASRLLNTATPDLKQICADYHAFYMAQSGTYQSATITLVDCSKLEGLAAACSDIISAHREAMELVDRSKIQPYFYNELHWFYDLRDTLVKMGAAASELSRLDAALDECVLYFATTPTFFGVKMTDVCGMSMYFPYPDKQELNNYYKTLSWNKATGLIQ